MGGLSPWHWAILAVVVVLLFGASRLPEVARSLGTSLRIFKAEVRELRAQNASEASAAPTTVAPDRVDPPVAEGRSD